MTDDVVDALVIAYLVVSFLALMWIILDIAKE